MHAAVLCIWRVVAAGQRPFAPLANDIRIVVGSSKAWAVVGLPRTWFGDQALAAPVDGTASAIASFDNSGMYWSDFGLEPYNGFNPKQVQAGMWRRSGYSSINQLYLN